MHSDSDLHSQVDEKWLETDKRVKMEPGLLWEEQIVHG